MKIKSIRELLEKTIETVKEKASKIYSKELVETSLSIRIARLNL